MLPIATGPAAIIADLISASREHESVGDLGIALRCAMEALDVARQAGYGAGETAACVALATAHIRLGHYPVAESLLDQALGLAGPFSPERAEALLLSGICAGETDDLRGAETCFREAVDLSRQVGADEILIRGLHALSTVVHVPRGEFELSLAADAEALKLAQDRGLPALVWRPVLTMCWVHWLTGQQERVVSMLDELRRWALPGSIAEGYWYIMRAGLATDAGDYDKARELSISVRSLAEANGIAELGFYARMGMSRLARVTGDAPSALAWAADAVALAEHTGYRHLQGIALIERGRAAWALGHVAEAESDFRLACTVLEQLSAYFDLARSMLLLAVLLHTMGSPQAGAAWGEAITRIVAGGFVFLLDQERTLAFPLLAAYLDASEPDVRMASVGLVARLAQLPPPPLRIVALGEFAVLQGGHRIPERAWAARRAGELFRLLCVSPGYRLTRDQAVEALWPDKEPTAAAAQLHQATSALRRALEPDLPRRFPSRYLTFEDGVVGLRLPSGSWIDFEVFGTLLQQQRVEEAIALWGGELFPGDLYADWAAEPREALRTRYLRALLILARQRMEEGNAEAVLALCDRVLSQEAWHEEAVLLKMRACIDLGDRVGAIRLYRSLEQALRDEFNIEPQSAVRVLYQSIVS